MLTFIVVKFSVAALYVNCFIQMTLFPVTKGLTGVPVKTMPCHVVPVDERLQAVHARLRLVFPNHWPWCHGNIYAEAEVCVLEEAMFEGRGCFPTSGII